MKKTNNPKVSTMVTKQVPAWPHSPRGHDDDDVCLACQILDLVTTSPKPLSTHDVAERMEIECDRAELLLDGLAELGEAKHLSGQRWAPAACATRT